MSCASEGSFTLTKNKQPNILVMLTDDHAQWALGCYGTPEVHSPNMDFLAETGARMENAFTPCPVSSPARASFFTGRLPSQHGIHDWLAEHDPEIGNKQWLAGEVTLYQQLLESGYHVGHFGKWHCGQSHVPQPGVHRWFSLQRNQGVHSGPYSYNDEGLDYERNGFKSRIITDQALSFINADHAGKPWFAFVGPIATHSPHRGLPERLVERYRKLANKTIGTLDPPSDAHVVYPKEKIAEFQAQYLAAVTEIDEQLGRLLDALDETGELDNTLIIYTADHGLHAGQLGYWQKGNGTRPLNMYERSIRIPMLLRSPGWILPGQKHEEFVDLCDLFHTILEFADARLDRAQVEKGKHVGGSFVDLLGDEKRSWRSEQFCEYGPVRMIRTIDHKLIRRHGHGEDQLFDLRHDPNERRNAISDPSRRPLIEELDHALQVFFTRHENPEKCGLKVMGQEGVYNHSEPWRSEYEGYCCAGWPKA